MKKLKKKKKLKIVKIQIIKEKRKYLKVVEECVEECSEIIKSI